MANINLLPWREERRQELNRAFLAVLGFVAVVAVVLVFLANRLVSGAIDHQQNRNTYLQKHIDELSQQVAEIKELEDKGQQLEDRMKVIQALQGNRPIIVRVFDEMVRTLPDGAFFISLKRTGDTVDLAGIAESNNRISSLMRRLNKSEWFASPNLNAVNAEPDYGEQASNFGMTFNIATPQSNEEEK